MREGELKIHGNHRSISTQSKSGEIAWIWPVNLDNFANDALKPITSVRSDESEVLAFYSRGLTCPCSGGRRQYMKLCWYGVFCWLKTTSNPRGRTPQETATAIFALFREPQHWHPFFIIYRQIFRQIYLLGTNKMVPGQRQMAAVDADFLLSQTNDLKQHILLCYFFGREQKLRNCPNWGMDIRECYRKSSKVPPTKQNAACG